MEPTGYSFIDHTADLGFEIIGATMEKLLANAGRALFETQIAGTFIEKKEIAIELTSETAEDLLVDWCRELLYNFSVSAFIPCRYDITIDDLHLKAGVRGDILDRARHRVKIEIKNATYHNLKVEKTSSGYRATIIFDV